MKTFDEKITEFILRSYPQAQTPDIKLWAESCQYWAPANYSHASDWVGTIVQLVSQYPDCDEEKLIVKTSELITTVPTFLHEKSTYFGLLKKQGVKDIESEIKNIKNTAVRQHMLSLLEATKASNRIVSLFSSDEVFSITFLRHMSCHPTLDGFSVRMNIKNGNLGFDTEVFERLKTLQPHPKNTCQLIATKLAGAKADLIQLQDLLSSLSK